MSAALDVTARDLIRALGNAAAIPAVDDAVRERAEAAAAALAGDGVVTRVLRRGAGAYTVQVTGEGVFTREFGSRAGEAEPFVAAAIRQARRP